MPKIFGLNSLGVIAASIAFYFVGFLWYGILFPDLWMQGSGYVAEQFEGQSPVWMVGGFLITIMQVIGIGVVLRWRGAADIGGAVKAIALLWLLLALPFCHYHYLYGPIHDAGLLMVDASHFLVGWVISAVILSLLK